MFQLAPNGVSVGSCADTHVMAHASEYNEVRVYKELELRRHPQLTSPSRAQSQVEALVGELILSFAHASSLMPRLKT